MEVCKFEQRQRGSCNRGHTCRYRHDLASTNPGLSPLPKTLKATSVPFTPGLQNISQVADALPTVTTTTPVSDSRSDVACRFFLQGRCTSGTNCPFSHAVKCNDQTQNGQLVLGDQQVDREGESASSTHIKRSYNGLEVIFGSGAEVQTVTLIQDFSSVSISGLEANTTKAAVQDLLEKHGQNVQDAVIKITPTNGGVVALITVRDPAFSSNILQKFGNDLDLIPSNHEIRIQKVQPELKSGTSAQRVNCRSVLCSRHKPTRTVSLDFGGTEQQLARNVMNKFNNGFYEFSDQRVKVMANLMGRTGSVRRFTRPPLWRVVLSNVPGEVLEADVRRMLGDKEKPESCRLGEPSYTLSPHAAAEKIRKRLLEMGPLEDFEMKHDPSSKRYKATATFTENSDAMTAYAALNDQPLPFGNGKLSIELNVTAKLKVLTKVYDAVKIEIGNLCDECTNDSNVRFNFYRPTQPTQRLTTIRVSGADASDVATVKNKLDTILSGRLVRDNEGCNVWHTALIGETGSQLISELETRFKVIVLREITTSTLRLYGKMDDCEACSRALRKLAAVSEDDSHEIPLDSHTFANITKGSYSMLRARLGMQNVSLKVTSASKKIVIKGSEREVKLAHQILRQAPDAQPRHQDDDCSICWTTAEKPVVTHCSHVYCAECFELMCSAAASGLKDCKIDCQGESGECQQTLTLNELQENMTSSAIEAILESSMHIYLDRRPDVFRACPTTDCPQVYRVRDNQNNEDCGPKTLLCPRCLNHICLSCRACHGRISCEEWKYISSGQQAEADRLMKELGIKECPKCGVAIEKTEGCNHMQCTKCSTHICWVCLKTFSESKPTYDHMIAAHGHIGLGV